jgi:hypothetical protein
MKKTLLITVGLFFIASFVQAQINKGSVLLGGNLSASTNKYKTDIPPGNDAHQNGFAFSPSVGIATKTNTVWGISLGYSHYKNESIGATGTVKNDSYSAGIFYRKYAVLGKGFYLFGEADADYSLNKQNSVYINDNKAERKSWSIGVSASPGVAYAVSKRFHLEAGLNQLVSLSYGHTKETAITGVQKYTTTSNGFPLSTNLSSSTPLTIGFRFVLAK